MNEDTKSGNTLERLLRAAKGLLDTEDAPAAELRKQPRECLHIPCSVQVPYRRGVSTIVATGLIHNVSTGGAGLLMVRRLERGQPLEITMIVEGKPAMYLGGTVTFCKELGDGVFQTGVQIFNRSKSPLLDGDPKSVGRMLDWAYDLL